MSTFGNRLKRSRAMAKLSQAQLGKAVGLSQSVISDLENDRQLETTLNVQLAIACGVDPVWLVTGLGDAMPVALAITRVWEQLDHERQGRLLAYGYDLLIGQGVPVIATDNLPFAGVAMPRAPVKQKS